MMGGLYTLDSASAANTYTVLSSMMESSDGNVSIYSRLPMRQLLRYVASNHANMWWISEHDGPRSIQPHVAVLEDHILRHLSTPHAMLIVEGMDWLVSRDGAQETLAWLQRLHGVAVERDIDVVLPVDSLSMETQVWRRIAGLAPAIEQPAATPEPVVHDERTFVETEETSVIEMGDDLLDERILTHLVNLPLEGFSQTLLGRRMLQWKRMGFDLAALEPALSINDLSQVHALYSSVESNITLAIDGLRLMERYREKLSVTEREMFNYRMMSLNDVERYVLELEELISSR